MPVLLRRRKKVVMQVVNKPNTKTKCFCGAAKPAVEMFCSWECRLINNRCKQWGIPLSKTEYEAHSTKLDEEQAQIDREMHRKYGSCHYDYA